MNAKSLPNRKTTRGSLEKPVCRRRMNYAAMGNRSYDSMFHDLIRDGMHPRTVLPTVIAGEWLTWEPVPRQRGVMFSGQTGMGNIFIETASMLCET